MNDTTQLEQALRSLAEVGGEPDEDAAWTAVQRSIAAADRTARRRRWLALASTAAIGATAAGLVVVTTRPSTDQAVDVGPATPGADAPDPSVPDQDGSSDVQSQVGTPIVLPEDPAVLISGEGSMLNVMDTATGERVETPLSNLPEDERITAATITADGDIYFSLAVPESTVLARTRWDAHGEYEVLEIDAPAFAEGGAYTDPTVDPTGSRLAFQTFGRPLDSDPEDPMAWTGAIGVLDLRSGEARTLGWPGGDDRGPLHGPSELSFSPDGTRLAFVNSHDTDGTDLFEAYVLDLATASSLADARLVGDQVADVVFGPDGRVHGLVGQYGDLRFEVLEGDGPGLGAVDGWEVRGVTRTAGGTVVAVTEDEGWFRHVAGEKWTATGWDGWHD